MHAPFSNRPTPHRHGFGVRLCLPLLAAALLGCDQPPAADGSAAQVEPPPTPEKRFDSIVATLKRKLENGKLSGINATTDYNAPAGTPVTNAKVSVSHELTPPSAEGEPYRGVIVLSTKSKVTVVLPQPTEEENAAAKAKRKAKLADLESDLEGMPDLDMLAAPKSTLMAPSPIHEIEPDETESRFELEFRDGLWRLVSDLDRDNEPFYAIAIEYALKRQ